MPISTTDDLPPRFDRETDRAIPDRVVMFYRGAAEEPGPPVLRRPLSEAERGMLEHRIRELRRAVAPFDATHSRALALEGAVSAMIGGFLATAGRLDGPGTALVAKAFLFAARAYPPWAIVEACDRVRGNRAGLNPNYCPTEPAFVSVVAACVALYADRLRQTETLLAATVEARAPEGHRPTAEEVACILGRPIGAKPDKPVPPPPGDGRHAERVRQDLERRRQMHTQEQPSTA